ncbi:hypothetical protein ACJRO7_004275 [Eucalyptus globulus]|uniref:Malectin-like domain-containing protein n=1 Tax=Eucalyptus globulus TaxID=34317 RepID=A0ABD3J0H1_EUCGL
MKPPLLLLLSISILLEALLFLVTGNNVGAYSPIDDIAVNCSSPGNSSESNWTWIGDAEDGSTYSPTDEIHSSINANASRSSPSFCNLIPYHVARLSRSEFIYTFRVTAGPRFVRLHLLPSDYLDFRRANSFFSIIPVSRASTKSSA